MTLEQAVITGLALLAAVLSAVAAIAAWRALGRAGRALNDSEQGLAARTATLSPAFAAVRERLAAARGAGEGALWEMAATHDHMDAAMTSCAAARATSDTLRASMARNHVTLERMRDGTRLLLRAIQMRREFLG